MEEKKWYQQKVKEVENKLETNKEKGLTEKQVKERREKYGYNELKATKKKSIIQRFLDQFKDFSIIVLIIAAIVSGIVGVSQGEGFTDTIIILIVVIVNAIIGVAQESKAEKSLEALQKLSDHAAKVIREGNIKVIPAKELVPGDIVVLDTGDYIPADLRIIEAINLKAQESSLTGESVPVEKNTEAIENKETGIGDCTNMLFSSSLITYGRGKGIVVETGMTTEVGKIAGMMNQTEKQETPLQQKLNQLGKTLGIVALIICAVIFVVGLMQGKEAIQMFMTAVSLAVAAIPEGLVAVSTIVLAIGVQKMVKKHAIVKKLPAVETLGSSSVICSDKTGTLTQNKMKVVETKTTDEKKMIEYATLCTDCEITQNHKVIGEPTEKAIVEKALEIGINKRTTEDQMQRIAEIPFDSTRKMMTTIHKKGNKYIVITKGAPDILIERCEITNKAEIRKQNLEMANKALRVIAVGYKEITTLPNKITSENTETNLKYLGLIGMIDPAREGVKEAVKTCKKAGIKTVMITGDHIQTAKAIAKELEIMGQNDKAITGQELDKITQKELEKNIKEYSVFARVTPEHKVRIVKAWQKTGAVVAMTGDGVNDSPALKNADIGIAMGKNGTDVAKNASDMILTDDNFVTIVEAVKQGRNIYDNIKKAIHFLIATNIGEIVTIFMGLILGMKSPLLAIQLLWINLVTDSLPAIALGLEPEEKDIMNRKPIDSRKGIFSDGLWSKIIIEGIMIGMLTLISFSIGNKYYSLEIGRTMAFITIGMLELIHSFNIKSDKSILEVGIMENKYLIGSFLLGVFVQNIVAIIPTFADIFELHTLNSTQWIITIIISFMPIPIMELQKLVNKERLSKKNITKINYKEKTIY